ncbi:MAG: right-handed parallel beta-helix repeat-containing protein [Anaerolineae bacterium]
MRQLTRIFIVLGMAFGLVLALMLALAQPSHAATYTVNSTDDVNDGTCNTSHCSLREAINAANSNPGADSITFDGTLFSAGGVITITNGTLTLSDDDTSIDGDLDNDGDPEVEVRYSSGTVGSGSGLIRVQSSNNTIEGLAVTNSPENGIYVSGVGVQADDNQIVSCWLGLDLTGAARPNDDHGVRIVYVAGVGSSADGNVIQDSVLSGNDERGISIQDATNTQVLSNTVGLNPDGSATRPNGTSGIALFDALATTIQGNLVSGNSGSGIYLQDTQQVTITGNVIGLNAAGDTALGNQGTGGINVYTNALTLVIRDNTISGNRNNGIYLGQGTTGAAIAGNRIGTDVAGTAGLGNGRLTNRDGIQLNDAYSNTIGGPDPADRNIIAHNGRAGVFIAGEQADHNVVQNNAIGTGFSSTTDLGNGDGGSSTDTGDGGVYLYDGADYNVVRDNTIRFNYIGLRFSGGSSLVTPPQHNQVLTNTLTSNDKYGVVNQTTHWNITYPTPSDGDNLIQNNTITGTGEGCALPWCTGIGIFNYGGSPRIVSNTISQNSSFGIVNRVYFGTDGPDDAADDLLSMPHISGNTISSNGDDGIQSRDTTPLNKATLLDDNTFVNNSGQPHISQRWFVGVEVVSGTQTINSGLAVTITRQGGGQACPGGPCVGSDFTPAGGSDGVWGPSGIVYTDVENLDDGTTTWFEVIEYEVNWQGTWVTYTSHLVEVGGAEQGSRYFDFDGITTTGEISGEVNLPFCIATGITGTSHSLCRYQIGQVPTFASSSDGDWDDDGIPDEEEGTGDTDGDGTPDYQDSDSDGDGIPDEDEYDWCGNPPCDSDGDGTPDYQDSDSDNDGIPDSIEGSGDTDGDTTPDYADTDADGDGILDSIEGNVDSDGDTTPDYKDTDSDNDGIADNAEGSGDTDGDGHENFRDTDSDNDGLSDDVDPDDDNDGIPDTVEGLVDNPGVENDSSVDTDGDGLPDYLDSDSDDDGVPDGVEAGSDPNNPMDTDEDGTPDYQDEDDDGDGIDTQYEDLDDDGDFDEHDTDDNGTPNYLDNDDDGDGKPTANENADPNGDGNPADAQDTDGDDTPDYLDPEYTIYLPLTLRNS